MTPSIERVVIRPARASDETQFLAAVRRSRSLHHPWVAPPSTAAAFHAYLDRRRPPRSAAFFVWLSRSHELAGVINLDQIVYGCFQSAYLGYYAFLPHAGHGWMRRGLSQVITRAFRRMKLHRLEANIQPGNAASLGLVKSLGFELEGLSPRYLKIAGRWRDHERWTILSESWKSGSGRHE
jgi:ribosomal-protein-alanine N-acetyltransferase